MTAGCFVLVLAFIRGNIPDFPQFPAASRQVVGNVGKDGKVNSLEPDTATISDDAASEWVGLSNVSGGIHIRAFHADGVPVAPAGFSISAWRSPVKTFPSFPTFPFIRRAFGNFGKQGGLASEEPPTSADSGLSDWRIARQLKLHLIMVGLVARDPPQCCDGVSVVDPCGPVRQVFLEQLADAAGGRPLQGLPDQLAERIG